MTSTAASGPCLASALLGLALLTSPGADAAVETCQGTAATIVGSVGAKVVGTEGRDVVITGGATSTRTLGGDDLVCLTVARGGVDAGGGNDVVDASAGTGASVVLGTGADRFSGSSSHDDVRAGDGVGDQDADAIDTGPAGAEDDLVFSGADGEPNLDQITLGLGTLQWSGLAPSTNVIDGGRGSELVLPGVESDAVAIDVVEGRASVDTVASLGFQGFTRFRLDFSLTAPGSLVFRGSPAAEVVDIAAVRFPPDSTHSVDMGAGDDRISIEAGYPIPRGVRLDGGIGRDVIDLVFDADPSIRLDLGRGRLSITRGKRNTSTAPAIGFEDATVLANGVEVVGTDGPNTLKVHACRLSAHGRGGSDTIAWTPRRVDHELLCTFRGVELDGGRGRDLLIGSDADDRIDGGAGRDVAKGRAGRDTCRVERQTGCEARR